MQTFAQKLHLNGNGLSRRAIEALQIKLGRYCNQACITTILLAWVLTLPFAAVSAGSIYLFGPGSGSGEVAKVS